MGALLALALAAGPAHGRDKTQPLVVQSEVLDRPQLGVTATAEAGEAILESGRQNTYDGLELSNTLTWGDGVMFMKFTIQPGKLKATRRDAKYIYYFSDRMTEDEWPKPPRPWADGGLCAEVADPAKIRFFFRTGQCDSALKTPAIVRPTQVVDVDPASPYRGLIYSGRDGPAVTFVYREASGDPAKPPTWEEFRFDLAEGATVEVKGAVIEILEAKPERLTYRVVAGFPAPAP